MKEYEMMPIGDLSVSEACENESVSEFRKWSSHFASYFLETEEAI